MHHGIYLQLFEDAVTSSAEYSAEWVGNIFVYGVNGKVEGRDSAIVQRGPSPRTSPEAVKISHDRIMIFFILFN